MLNGSLMIVYIPLTNYVVCTSKFSSQCENFLHLMWYLLYVLIAILLLSFTGELSPKKGYHCNGKSNSREAWLSAEIQGIVS